MDGMEKGNFFVSSIYSMVKLFVFELRHYCSSSSESDFSFSGLAFGHSILLKIS
jgi:hypothetical protein